MRHNVLWFPRRRHNNITYSPSTDEETESSENVYTALPAVYNMNNII